ncbi:MAG: NnrS family protein [Reyranellaceae bacterium]
MRASPHPIPLLDHGFRPFFLLAGLWAPLAIGIWIIALATGTNLPTTLPLIAWHPHELIFGYGGAAVAGFLLTAIPNWTGRLPLRGGRLLALAALWLAARLAGLGGIDVPVVAVALDVGFWIALAMAAAREVVAGRNWRNLPVVALIATLGLSCLLSQSEALGFHSGPAGRRLGLATLVVLIGLIGGRVVPSFTRNWLVRQKSKALPAPSDRLDKAAMAVLVPAVLAWVVWPELWATGLLLALAGAATLLRLSRWRGLATFGEPLVSVLHAGFGWLGLGLLLHGLGTLMPDSVGRLATLHALTTGAVGTMTLAIMTRATLGHTGHALAADRCTLSAYVLVQAGAALRVVAPVLPMPYTTVLAVAATLWASAFALFLWRYAPFLVAQKPGPG